MIMVRQLARQGLLTLMCLFIGFAIVTQLRTYDKINGDIATMSLEERSNLVISLIDRKGTTQREIDQIKLKNEEYRRAQNNGQSTMSQLVTDLSKWRAINGAVQVRGQGVQIVVDYPLRAADVMALVNEIRNGGAEAIAINNQRIVARTTISETEGVLSINGIVQSAPYTITALGDSQTLMGALNRIGGLIRIWNEIDGVAITIEPRDSLTIPRLPDRQPFRYAQPAP
ncbi:MAG: DUF881 domain-containing protein [Herpetosiphon sp.]|nr:DUF881 domain-containing protein [Herpetosiphon sp.]